MSDNVASLTLPAALQVKGPPVLSFQVAQWTSDKDVIKGAELTLYECDYEDEWSPGRRDPSGQAVVATLSFDLKKNPDATQEPRVEWLVSAPRLVKGKKGKDVTIFLGGEGKKRLAFDLAVPRDAGTFHDEGADFEIGWTFKAAGAELKRLDTLQTQLSTIEKKDPLEEMLGLKKTATVGRFSDTSRNPHFAPADAFRDLDTMTKDALRVAGAGPLATPIDVDGLRFSNFVRPERRRAVIDDLASASSITIAKPEPTKKVDADFIAGAWKTTDLQKAYFVLHDVATDEVTTTGGKETHNGSYRPQAGPDRLSTKAYAEGKVVTGFVNMNGSLVVVVEMKEARTGGTNPWTTDNWASQHSLAYESFPACTANDDERDTKTDPDPAKAYDYSYVCIGYDDRTNVYVKWPKTVVDTWAKLYILASARSNHLLTLTTHMEIGHAEHNDPRCFDMQVLYDAITEKLVALARREGGPSALILPTGVRYGVNPRRSYDPAELSKGKTRPRNITNPKGWHFPHQSGTWKT